MTAPTPPIAGITSEAADTGHDPSGQALVQAPSPSVSALTGFDPSREVAEYLSGVVGVVEANSYEQHMLWLEYAADAVKFGRDRAQRYSWKATGLGWGSPVGEVAGRKIWISLLTAVVREHKLLFWHPTSSIVDHDQCDAWLRRWLPTTAFRPDGYLNRSDPMNFCNVFPHDLSASAIEARSGETRQGLDPKDESAVGESRDAQGASS